MEQEIKNIARLFLAGFAVLAIGAGYWQIWRGPALAVASGNPRVIEEARRAHRGRIIDRAGRVMAQSQDGQRVVSGAMYAHITGYVSERFGTTGLERVYDRLLLGRQGVPAQTDLLWRLVGTPRHGGDVLTTIDADLQAAADAALGNARGAAVVMDVRTGAVLALVSKPYFDPTRVSEAWTALSQDEGRPLYNRVSQGLYVPGSTFKVVTAAAALDTGLMQPSTMVSDPTGETIVDGFRITDAERPPRPTFDFAHAFAWSSNVVFAQVGLQLGEARLRDYAGRFGVGTTLPFELETSATAFVRAPSMSRPLLASTAFGQGELLISPLQMAVVAATVSRDGTVPRPYIVRELRGPAGNLVQRTEPGSLGTAISPATARALREMLVLAVDEGFGRNFAIPGVRVGGKTGTAQSVPGMPDHSWFIGIAPADQPRYAVAVILEFGGWGATEAAPAARQIMERALRLP